MTPSGINLKIVRERLSYVEDCVAGLRALPAGSREEFLDDRRNPLAAESLLRRALEGLFDTARHLLAAGFGAGSLEYRQVAEESVRRGLVLEPETARRFRQMAGYRNRLVHHYEDVNSEELFALIEDRLVDLEQVAAELRAAAGRLVAGSG